ncbi:hypothetical protein THAOC_06593 [Thalassiosira oceanica]|uniref:Uncharacterized protein n=1 Tax=Thalassiosira oceanica TaxID=159749 RepID=K0T448_THAOC|nr:hypothetical protein THAOC_06593 [Thalassiosira oceanica]|eukprot:EJK71919.1 hypothetical protein THAOC_06593 [Thalassiosira oceanica]
MVPDGHAALQGLSSIPHLTSVAAAFYRSAMGAVIGPPGEAMGRQSHPAAAVGLFYTADVIYQNSRYNGKFVHHVTSLVCQGLRADSLIASLLWKPASAIEVRCGIELSLCSAACPSGTIYTSLWPDICAGLLSGTSAAQGPSTPLLARYLYQAPQRHLGGTTVGWPPVRSSSDL